jgi:hypothetical protein
VEAPGRLDELGAAGRAAWDAVVADTLERSVEKHDPQGLTTDSAVATEIRAPDWPSFPARIAAERGAGEALVQMDLPNGRLHHQEEYLEWRVVRKADAICRIELTTELREYWQVLAAHEPDRSRALIAEFAGVDEVAPEHVYGALGDPSAATAEARAAAFAQTMLPVDDAAPASPYNNGTDALCCLIHSDNTLAALVDLVLSAARPLLVEDVLTGRTRYPSGSEAIRELNAAARDGRNSDPLIVERVTRLATERRAIGIDDPVGIVIRSVEHHELAQPDGTDVPASWFTFSRGVTAEEAPDGLPRHQRLTFALAPDADFALSDLVVRRTGERLRHGGQLAALVQLTVYLRTGLPGSAP